MRWNPEKKTILGSACALALLLSLNFIALQHILQEENMDDWVIRSHQVEKKIAEVLGGILQIESSLRGYIITGDEKFLESYETLKQKIGLQLNNLEFLIDDETQLQRADSLKSLTKEKIALSSFYLALRKNAGFAAVSDSVASLRGKNIMDGIHEMTGRMLATEKNLLEERIVTDKKNERDTMAFMVIGNFIAILIFLTAALIAQRHYQIRKQTEKALITQKERAEQSEKIKDRFISNMSHEIRTPLNAIIGFTEQLQKISRAQRQKEYLNSIQTASINLLHLVEDLLDVSKIESGMLKLEQKPFSIPVVMKYSHMMFSKWAEDNKLKFTLFIDKAIPRLVVGDSFRLMQIITNLIGNAIKFTQQGSVHAGCELEEKTPRTAKIRFTVKDTGIGIEKDRLDKIFNRFEQSGNDNQGLFGGVGLGLAIAKELVELHGGKIMVSSEPNRGSEFCFIIRYPISAKENSPVMAAPPVPEVFHLNHARILIAEDNEMNQKLTRVLLEDAGCQITVTTNGAEAISMLEKENFDLILMDLKMPVMDGYTATKKIREKKLNIPIIAMTAHGTNGEKENCIQHGINDCITKPFHEKELLEIISKYLHRSEKQYRMAHTSGIIQLDYLKEISKGNRKFIEQMIATFVSQNPEEISRLEAAIEGLNYDAIQTISHKMQTSISFIGLSPVIGNLLAEMEEMSERNIGNRRNQDALSFGKIGLFACRGRAEGN